MPQAFSAYSFKDVRCAIVGPGGAFSMGNEAGVGESGISIEMTADKDTMLIGADGSVMHSLAAGQGGTVTIRLLKVSSVNFQLSMLYDLQTASSALWGQNVITIADTSRGDVITCLQCAFRRQPANLYAKDGNILEWAFNAGHVYGLLGVGTALGL